MQDVLIDGENQRNAYWQLYVDEAGTIHLSWVWRETGWWKQTMICVMHAHQTEERLGKKSNGETYALPINATNAEYACRIPQNSELINQTSMSANKDGHPFIATYWRSANSNVPQYRLVWFDGKQWRQQQVTQR